MKLRSATFVTVVLVLSLLGGCAARAPTYDYSAFMKARPASLLVMPPISESPDIKASPAVWAQATRPLAEAGYYVLPVTLVDETFRQNGIETPNDAQDIPYPKLHEFFGADAAVYIKVTRYGTSYVVVATETRVEAEARIIDLRSGELLWQGKAVATSAEQQQYQGGLVGLLVTAMASQIIGTTTDVAFGYAAIANTRLLGTAGYNGVLPGPRSPSYGKAPGAR